MTPDHKTNALSVRTMINMCKCGGGRLEKLAFVWQTKQRLIRLTDRPAIGSRVCWGPASHFLRGECKLGP